MDIKPPDCNAAENDPGALERRIAWNHKSYNQYNIGRIREMLRYLPPRRVRLFRAIPFLLHVNHPELTGFVADHRVPFGISRFYQSGYWKAGLKQFGLSQAAMRPFLPDEFWIHGLYLMGSTGTLAQTKKSDFDYWVIVDKAAKDPARLALLQKKLDRICRWGQSAYDQQIAFFILDIDKVRRNDFAAVDSESSGSAQKTLLKEEFYRTFIVVAGQVPYWAVLPAGLTAGEYNRCVKQAGRTDTAACDPTDYLDLGPLDHIAPSECLSALLWQIYKARKDPVKALIKGALLTHYHFFQDESGLLCDHIKRRFFEPGGMTNPIDPYAAVFETAESFLDRIQNPGSLDLVRTCIFFRLIGFPRKHPIIPDSPKHTLLERFLRKWNWPTNIHQDLENYEKWPIQRLADFEAEIIGKLGFLFELVRQHGIGGALGSDMTPADLQGLKNRIAATFRPRAEKVPRCPLVIRHSMPRNVALAYRRDPSPQWRLAFAGDDRELLQSSDLGYVAGWIICNHLVAKSLRNIRVRASDPALGPNRVVQLLKQAAVFFNGASTDNQDFQAPPSIERVLGIVYNQSARPADSASTVSFLWRNTWGEMFCRQKSLEATESNWSRCYAVAGHLQAIQSAGNSAGPICRVLDYRLQPDSKMEQTVLDMLASMELLNQEEGIGPGRTGNMAEDTPDAGPLLDLF